MNAVDEIKTATTEAMVQKSKAWLDRSFVMQLARQSSSFFVVKYGSDLFNTFIPCEYCLQLRHNAAVFSVHTPVYVKCTTSTILYIVVILYDQSVLQQHIFNLVVLVAPSTSFLYRRGTLQDPHISESSYRCIWPHAEQGWFYLFRT